MQWRAPVLFLSLAGVVLALLWFAVRKEDEPVSVSYAPLEPVTLAVAADVHFIAPTLTDNGAAFTHVITAADGKVMRFSSELTEAFFSQIAAERPDCLILAGDLTFNGARESHEAFAAYCETLEQTGVPVLVLPGNHDLNYPEAARFHGDTFDRVDSISAEDFRTLYAPYGYDEALSADGHSLSYVYPLRPGLRLLLVDSNTDPQYDTVPDATFAWIEAQLHDAAQAGDRVIAVSHQTLLQHNPKFSDGFVITNRERLLHLYRKYHVTVNLSGHMHIQHRMQSGALTEIVTSALSVQPCQYGVLRLTGEGGSYETRCTDVSAWARSQGREEPELLDFETYALDFFLQNNRLHSSGLSAGLADALGRLNAAYYSGRMDQTQITPEQLRALRQQESVVGVYVESLAPDLGEDYTHASFTFQE